jgi:hypothetical protein
MTHRTDISRRMSARLCTLWIAALCLALASCEMPQDKTLPTLSDIRPSDQTDQPADSAEAGRVIVMIYRIDLPLDERLERMWQEVDEGAIPFPMRGKWMINGLRIGVLHAQQSQAFSDALPGMLGESRAKLVSSDYPSTIRTTPRLRSTVGIDLTDPPRSPTEYRAIGGRLQLLAQTGRDEQGQAYLQLTPHHYKHKATLLPRSPLEKEMDGRTFETLSVRIPLPMDRAVIVGLYRPWPVKDEAPTDLDPSVQDKPASSRPDKSDTPDQKPAEASPPAIPDHLGKALMTGTRAGKPTQMLLVISALDE